MLLRQLSALIIGGVVSVTVAANERPYEPVTDARLTYPEPSNWLQYRGNYAGWGYSPLAQINDQNIRNLWPAWSYSTSQLEGHQAPPIVNNGYMYVTTPGNQILALDAKTGAKLWTFKARLPANLFQLHPTNRGVALYGDKVYMATVDCKLIALNAQTGKKAWTTEVCDWKSGYYMTLAPLAANGKIMVGTSGGEMGIRGFVAGFDAETGEEKWRTYTVPAPDEPGGDTWPAGDAYKTGGGSVWITGTYDPETNLAFWGTGNPSPWTPESREGDNLYTTSAIALDVDTGEIKGYHQYHWHDSWDWDEVSAPLLIDTQIKGRSVKAAIHAGRNGYLWILERTADKINFVDAWPYIQQNVFTSIDPKTGRPSYDESRKPNKQTETEFCPSLWGGKDWPPEAYNPNTGFLYIPANNNMCAKMPPGEDAEYKPGELFIGFSLEGILTSVRVPKPDQTIGELQAWDLRTGELAWVQKYPSFLWAPLLTTAGNLVFAGGTNDRKFRAFNAKDGKLLWEFPAPSGVIGVPVSYEVDGEQYIAVQSGWGVDADRIQGAMNTLFRERPRVLDPEIEKVEGALHSIVPESEEVDSVPPGGSILVFKLIQ